ncbi:hypothetical protein [Pseudoalteromonas spongiae]|uniref:hypothetical protein n=1 Tax=Pseudoalteromonas spongiae TaxID=298657 RepID=UPI000C2D2292|nr:hypothetical protein [Pseudoalteromonas spongiae]
MTIGDNDKKLIVRDSSFAKRFPLILLNSISFLGLVNGLKTIPSFIGDWVNAWQIVTHKMWSFILNFDVPLIVSTYLTMTLITIGGFYRFLSQLDDFKVYFREKVFAIFIFKTYLLLWPLLYLANLPFLFSKNEKRKLNKAMAVALCEFLIYSAVIIAFAYVFFFIEQTILTQGK